jgi:hypothetical protein
MVYFGDMGEFLKGTLVASLVLLVLGLLYFMAALWAIKTGVGYLELTPDANWMVFSAALVSATSVLGSRRRDY